MAFSFLIPDGGGASDVVAAARGLGTLVQLPAEHPLLVLGALYFRAGGAAAPAAGVPVSLDCIKLADLEGLLCDAACVPDGPGAELFGTQAFKPAFLERISDRALALVDPPRDTRDMVHAVEMLARAQYAQARSLRRLRHGIRSCRLSLLSSLLRYLVWIALHFRLRLVVLLLCLRLLALTLPSLSSSTMPLLGPVRRSSTERPPLPRLSAPSLAETRSLPALASTAHRCADRSALLFAQGSLCILSLRQLVVLLCYQLKAACCIVSSRQLVVLSAQRSLLYCQLNAAFCIVNSRRLVVLSAQVSLLYCQLKAACCIVSSTPVCCIVSSSSRQLAVLPAQGSLLYCQLKEACCIVSSRQLIIM